MENKGDLVMMTVYPNGDGLAQLDAWIQFLIQPDCLEEPILYEALCDIEDVYKVEGLAMYSRKHGVKSPQDLSNGMKALILCYYYAKGKFSELLTNTSIGDNIAPYFQRLSLKYDFAMSWDCYTPFDWDAPILAKDITTGKVYHDVDSFQDELGCKGGKPDVPKIEFTAG